MLKDVDEWCIEVPLEVSLEMVPKLLHSSFVAVLCVKHVKIFEKKVVRVKKQKHSSLLMHLLGEYGSFVQYG